jgi:menaquinone-specific isochorismate synthase
MSTMPDNSSFTSIAQKYGRLVSIALPCPNVSFASFLYQARGQARFYWENSRDHITFAGTGTALELPAWGEDRFEKIRQQALVIFADAHIDCDHEPMAAPRLFGGFAFRDDFVPDNTWSDFTPAHFVLPHYQLVSINGDKWLTINTHLPYGENPNSILDDLRDALQERIHYLQEVEATPEFAHAKNEALSVSYPMSYETWHDIITNATQRMKNGDFNKVVLSRVAEVRFKERVNVDLALHYLAEHYADSYRFLFEPRPHHAFFGATPELIAGVRGKHFETMGLAGSIQRGATSEEDEHCAKTLLNSGKDRYEHEVVVNKIRERVAPLMDSLHIPEMDILRLNNIQHIYTPIKGELKQKTGVVPLVERLHPTPALGGDPREIAMKVIQETEPVPRGWYAAPVGWIDRNLDGYFSVAIRSAIAQERRVWLYAGAGIVADSEPDKEWNETALKFRPMLNALGIHEDILV